jgi:hypothetical protein
MSNGATERGQAELEESRKDFTHLAFGSITIHWRIPIIGLPWFKPEEMMVASVSDRTLNVISTL